MEVVRTMSTNKTEEILSKFIDERGRFMYSEFDHRYRGTLIGCKRDDRVCPIEVQECNTDGIIASDIGSGDYFNIPFDSKEINLDLPLLGLVPFKDHVLYVRHSRNMLWRRGLVTRSLSASDPLKLDSISLRRSCSMNNSSHMKTLVNSIFNHKYTSYEEAITRLEKSEKRAFPLNKNFFVAISSSSEDIVLGYKDFIVGHVDSKGEAILGDKVKHLSNELSLLNK